MLLLVDTLMFPFFPGFVPNATQIQQPMDVAVFRPFKSLLEKSLKAQQFLPEKEQPNINTFHKVILPCYLQAMNPENIFAGFRRAGIHPFNIANLDWTTIEGLELRDVAFWPEEGQDFGGLKTMGTNIENTLVVNVNTQTDHTGDIDDLNCIHEDNIRTY